MPVPGDALCRVLIERLPTGTETTMGCPPRPALASETPPLLVTQAFVVELRNVGQVDRIALERTDG